MISWASHRPGGLGTHLALPVASSVTTMSSTSDHVDLLKLSREKLRQFCKERGHTGYSKCTKPQLIALLESETPSKFNSSMMTTVQLPRQDTPSSASVPKKRLESGSSGLQEPTAKKQKSAYRIPSKTSLFLKPLTPPALSQAKEELHFTQKLPIPCTSFVSPISTTPATVPRVEQQQALLPAPHLPQLSEPTNSPLRPSGRNVRPHRFGKFLDPRKVSPASRLVPFESQIALRSTTAPPSSIVSVEPLPTPYLDFPELPIPILGLIGMPPSISDRKRVVSWSIILSGISNTERRTCILVSRMFRYAGKSTFHPHHLGYLICMLR